MRVVLYRIVFVYFTWSILFRCIVTNNPKYPGPGALGCPQIHVAQFMGPTWDPPGADRTQVGPMLAPWTLLSGSSSTRQYFVRAVCNGPWLLVHWSASCAALDPDESIHFNYIWTADESPRSNLRFMQYTSGYSGSATTTSRQRKSFLELTSWSEFGQVVSTVYTIQWRKAIEKLLQGCLEKEYTHEWHNLAVLYFLWRFVNLFKNTFFSVSTNMMPFNHKVKYSG